MSGGLDHVGEMVGQMDDKGNNITDKQRANLIPFKPGQSGNPKGCPRAKTQLYRYLCEYLEMAPEQLAKVNPEKLSLSRKGAYYQAKEIGEGKLPSINHILDRSDGKPLQRIEQDNRNVNLDVATEISNLPAGEKDAVVKQLMENYKESKELGEGKK